MKTFFWFWIFFFSADLPSPTNGFKRVANGRMTFGCKKGFVISDENVAFHCTDNGTWIGGQLPTCFKEIQCPGEQSLSQSY